MSSDSLEHFHTPVQVLREVERVLRPAGALVIWVPFMHPFHSNDYYRYTPLGLRHLLAEARLECDVIDAPLGLIWIYGVSLVALLHKLRLGRLGPVVERIAARLDRLSRPLVGAGFGYAAFYRVVARKSVIRRPEH